MIKHRDPSESPLIVRNNNYINVLIKWNPIQVIVITYLTIWMLHETETLLQRSITPKFATPIDLSCIYNRWRSSTLSPPKKTTSSTANLECCNVHFIRDSYSIFIRRVIGTSPNSMELFSNAKFDFKSTWNSDSTTSHHKHPVCQSPAGYAEKLTNVWSRYFVTNRIIDNLHRCHGVRWRKLKKYFDKWFKKNPWIHNFHFIDPQNYSHIMRTFLDHIKKWKFGWN